MKKWPKTNLPELATVRISCQIGKVPAGTLGTIKHVYPGGKSYEVAFLLDDPIDDHRYFIETVMAKDINMFIY